MAFFSGHDFLGISSSLDVRLPQQIDWKEIEDEQLMIATRISTFAIMAFGATGILMTVVMRFVVKRSEAV